MNAIATTWGISNALFLGIFVSLCVVAATAALLARRDPSATLGRNDPLPDLDPYRLAMLSGGPQLAITAAAAQLHADGLLRRGAEDNTLEVSGALPAGADRLERAVFDTVHHVPGITAAELRRQVANGDEVRWLTEDLTRVGLLDMPRSGSLAWGTIRLAGRRLPATRRGREILKRHRAARPELRSSPAAGDSAMAAALFGGGALWLTEPAFASTLDVPREAARKSGWNGGYGTCSAVACGGVSAGAGWGSGGSDGGGGGCGGGGCGGGS